MRYYLVFVRFLFRNTFKGVSTYRSVLWLIGRQRTSWAVRSTRKQRNQQLPRGSQTQILCTNAPPLDLHLLILPGIHLITYSDREQKDERSRTQTVGSSVTRSTTWSDSKSFVSRHLLSVPDLEPFKLDNLSLFVYFQLPWGQFSSPNDPNFSTEGSRRSLRDSKFVEQ